jgi:hypothetical protein
MQDFAQSQKKTLLPSSLFLPDTASPGPAPPSHPILDLQRTIGNRAARRLQRKSCSCGGSCPKCQKEKQSQESGLLQAKPDSGQTSESETTESAAESELPVNEIEAESLVKKGKWCRDSAASGGLHDPSQQCYREIPPEKGFPAANQRCFFRTTGEYAEDSPDFISAVSGQKSDGTCDLPLPGITDPPHPFSQRGLRALGHAISDIATEDRDLIGRNFGRFAGLAMGIALPKHGADSLLASAAIPSILGFIAGELGARGLPLLGELAQKHGFLPTISLGAGSNTALGLGIGLEKRDRPLPLVPVNSYLTFDLDSTLDVTGEAGASSTFLAKVGVRIDPGKQGGLFALGSIGAGLAAGRDVSGVTSREVGVGLRATDFLDVQVVHETVSGGGDGGGTYWLTLKLVAPQRVLKGHPKIPVP